MRCNYCGSTANWCYEDCECAKCVDPEGYQEWRDNNPEEYDAWIERELNKEDDGFDY